MTLTLGNHFLANLAQQSTMVGMTSSHYPCIAGLLLTWRQHNLNPGFALRQAGVRVVYAEHESSRSTIRIHSYDHWIGYDGPVLINICPNAKQC
jgi:hypothetical protein